MGRCGGAAGHRLPCPACLGKRFGDRRPGSIGVPSTLRRLAEATPNPVGFSTRLHPPPAMIRGVNRFLAPPFRREPRAGLRSGSITSSADHRDPCFDRGSGLFRCSAWSLHQRRQMGAHQEHTGVGAPQRPGWLKSSDRLQRPPACTMDDCPKLQPPADVGFEFRGGDLNCTVLELPMDRPLRVPS